MSVEAIIAVCEQSESVSAAGRALGVGDGSLHYWRSKHPEIWSRWDRWAATRKGTSRRASPTEIAESIRNEIAPQPVAGFDYKALRAENARRHAARFHVELSPGTPTQLPGEPLGPKG